MDDLIEKWLYAQSVDMESHEYDETCWAVDKLFDLAYKEPYELLKIIIDILKIDASLKIIKVLGAGVLEDLLVHNGDKIIERILLLSDSNLDFKRCLYFTYVDEKDVSPNVYKKIQEIKESLKRDKDISFLPST